MPRTRRLRIARAPRFAGLLLAAFLTACSDPLGGGDGPLQFRVENRSLVPFDAVLVVFPQDSVSFGRVGAGATSGYRDVARAYRYAYVEVRVGSLKTVQQPIDYVGESLLEPGRYTYVILPSDLTDPWGVRTELRRD